MIKINPEIKNFTHNQFKNLSKNEIDNMIKNKTPFLVSDIIFLEYDFTYCMATQNLYNKGKEISLTKIESKLLNLLMLNINTIVDYKTVEEIVWKGKNMSRFTMRNKIKDIRDKTYHEIIKNDSNIGYTIYEKSRFNKSS
ncbi:winged helix-turn-helix domain-containing protein [Poseidonibacter sp.]|uniref:winged helix-turn-helix domain-containing protein n=1 Tax=Poseidonibacter sp. TaxID=2321188 RepID=UPI003C75A5A2